MSSSSPGFQIVVYTTDGKIGSHYYPLPLANEEMENLIENVRRAAVGMVEGRGAFGLRRPLTTYNTQHVIKIETIIHESSVESTAFEERIAGLNIQR